jgi:lipid-A-disaccharide synthase
LNQLERIAGPDASVFVIAAEESGDQIGGALIGALRRELGPDFRLMGVGGSRMVEAGLEPIFPSSDVSIVGIGPILRRLPFLLGRIQMAADAVLAAKPDVLVIIDSPDFTHRVAKRVRAADPSIPIIDYVSPSVWAWRPGRARRMRPYVDHLLAFLPFEPEVHRKLGGPRCTYVGHAVIERLDRLRPKPGERPPLAEAERPVLLVLPGSRVNEITRLMDPFGEAIGRVLAGAGPQGVEVVLPAVTHLAEDIRKRAASWPVQPTIVTGEDAKHAAFRRAHAALAASGTVTLELALAGVPMVVAYRLDPIARRLKWTVKVQSIVLANLVLGENAIPEFIDKDSTPEALAAALLPLLRDSPQRARQVAAFATLDEKMKTDSGPPSGRAAEIIAEVVRKRRSARQAA